MVQNIKLKKIMIATIGIGYADGLPRFFSGNVYYEKYKFPIIGSISMDLCTIDITSHENLRSRRMGRNFW